MQYITSAGSIFLQISTKEAGILEGKKKFNVSSEIFASENSKLQPLLNQELMIILTNGNDFSA